MLDQEAASLTPPPHLLPLVRRDKQAKKRCATESNELYFAGNRVGRDELALFLNLLCGNSCCTLAFIRDVDSMEREMRSASTNAPEYSLSEAVKEWPFLITEEREQVTATPIDNSRRKVL